MQKRNSSPSIIMLAIYVTIIIFGSIELIKTIADNLGNSSSAGTRGFGAVLIVAIISLGVSLIIYLVKLFFRS